jgi:antitoxin component YwqK of YwqJK toxin-antitoxin module
MGDYIELAASDVMDEARSIRPLCRPEGWAGKVPHGRAIVFREKSLKLLEIMYQHGVPHGPYRDYWSNGELASEGSFKEGKRQGMWSFYRADGTLQEEILFEEGREVPRLSCS